MVWRVWKMLRLKAESVAEVVDLAPLADDCAVKEVTRVELDSGLRGDHLHNTTTLWFLDLGDHPEMTWKFVRDPIVIIPFAVLQLHVLIIDPGPDGGWLCLLYTSPSPRD